MLSKLKDFIFSLIMDIFKLGGFPLCSVFCCRSKKIQALEDNEEIISGSDQAGVKNGVVKVRKQNHHFQTQSVRHDQFLSSRTVSFPELEIEPKSTVITIAPRKTRAKSTFERRRLAFEVRNHFPIYFLTPIFMLIFRTQSR